MGDQHHPLGVAACRLTGAVASEVERSTLVGRAGLSRAFVKPEGRNARGSRIVLRVMSGSSGGRQLPLMRGAARPTLGRCARPVSPVPRFATRPPWRGRARPPISADKTSVGQRGIAVEPRARTTGSHFGGAPERSIVGSMLGASAAARLGTPWLREPSDGPARPVDAGRRLDPHRVEPGRTESRSPRRGRDQDPARDHDDRTWRRSKVRSAASMSERFLLR